MYNSAAAQREAFNSPPDPPGGGGVDCFGTGWYGELSLGLILVQFPEDDDYQAVPGGTYTMENFEDMAFSVDSYYDSPELVSLQGSMYDYYYEVSYGQATLVGSVVNPEDQSNPAARFSNNDAN